VEFELPGNDAIMFRDGEKLVIKLVRKRGQTALLDPWEPMTEGFPEIEDRAPAPEDIF
jgi:antitoxin VapB